MRSFNPRIPRGCDFTYVRYTDGKLSASTHAPLGMRTFHCYQTNALIHAALGMRLPLSIGHFSSTNLQSAHPSWDVIKQAWYSSPSSKLQLTHPYGMRFASLICLMMQSSFNPRIHFGCDFFKIWWRFASGALTHASLWMRQLTLQPAHPSRDAIITRHVCLETYYFNPRTPCGMRCSWSIGRSLSSSLQFAHSLRHVTGIVIYAFCDVFASIHTPREVRYMYERYYRAIASLQPTHPM